MMRSCNRSRRGQALIEAVCAAMILIPLALAILDFMVLVIANSNNDSCAKTAARSAANQSTESTALDAAVRVVDAAHKSGIVSNVDISMPGFKYDAPNGKVTVQTRVLVHLPIPFPGLSQMTFQAQAVETIVNFTP